MPTAWLRARDPRGFTALETLIVVALIGVIAAIAIPMSGNALGYYRLSGDARSVSNMVAVAKMRASASFGRARVYVDLNGKSFHIETQKNAAAAWVVDPATDTLNSQNAFSFGVVGSAPPNTQTTIGQAAACLNNSGTAIANTACIVFNSRGIPIDSTGAPLASALYVTDGYNVYGATLSPTGMTRLWQTPAAATPSWILQ